MSKFAHLALVAVFALVGSLAGASVAEADVTLLDAWTTAPQVTSGIGTSRTATFTPSAGSDRVIVVAVAAHTNNTTATTITVDYGNGTTWTPAHFVVYSANNQRRQNWLFYLNEADIAASSGNTIRVSNNNAGSGYAAWIATYAGVEQTVGTGSGFAVNGAYGEYPNQVSSATFTQPLAVEAGGFGQYFTMSSGNVEVIDNESYSSNVRQTVGSAYADNHWKAFPSAGSTQPAMSWGGATYYMGYAGFTLNPYVVTDSTAPTPGTVTVTPESGTYVPADFSISASFTDAESAVSVCEYTTNGSTWLAASVSGAGPYTCSASVTGASGSLTINMRATSAGGTGSATAISRTVDATSPSTGAVPAGGNYTADQIVTLTPTDAASGVASTVYCVDAANSCVPGSTYSAPVTVAGIGGSNATRYLRYSSTDNLGNVETVQSQTYNIDQSCFESGTVTLDALPDPITGVIAVTATAGGGAGTPEVSFDGGVTWVASGSIYTPNLQANYQVQLAARATGFCGGFIYDSNNPTLVNVDSRTPGLEANGASAIQSGLSSIQVNMSYCGDKNGNATFQVDYKLTSTGTWTMGTPMLDATNDGNYLVILAGLITGETYDVRMTYDDLDGLLAGTQVQSAVVTLVAWTDNPMLHNSNRFAGTTKHGGSWGTPGNYAGGITCVTCHEKTPVNGNIKRVKAAISFPDGTNMPNGASSTTVNLQSTTGFGDDSGAPRASSDKVCEVCHNYDATQSNGVKQHAANQVVAADHYDNSDCISCHQHRAGFKADCTACHGNPPTVNTLGGPDGLDSSVVTGSATAGKHDLHVNTLAYNCNVCHTGWENADEMPDQTVAGRLNIGFNAFGDTSATYAGRSGGTGYKAAAGTTVTTTGALTCSAIYCHGSAAPQWADAGTAPCGSCHGTAATGAPSETAGDGDLAGATTGTKVGKHVKHVAKYACTICHNGAGFGSPLHVNGSNDIVFSGVAAGTTYTAGTSTCSTNSCHSNAVWNTSSPALNCDSCHGYPPTPATSHAVGAIAVDHSAVNITAKHGECNTCHGKSLLNGETNNTASGGDQYLSSYHIDGNIELNGWATDSGTDAGYSQTSFGCARACHPDDASHQMSNSNLPVQLHRYGSGSCTGCHDGTGTGATLVNDNSPHALAATGYSCEDCHTAHSSGTIEIPNNAAIGINYTANGEAGIALGSAVATGATEAQICWNCHDSHAISEWGVNSNASTGSSPYNYGNLSTSNWTTATWSSSRTQFAYKTGAIQSTHTANPAVTDAALGGANYSKTETKNAVAEIRCSYCHDVHELALTPGDTAAGTPYLRGSWRGNPYEEDGAPRSAYANTTYFSTAAEEFGQVPRGAISGNLKIGGYWIDQNNVVPMSAGTGQGTPALNPTSTWTVDQFAGLCALCHGGGNASWTATEVDNIDQKTGEALWMGTNGHANSVKGGTGASSANSFNVFDARGGTAPGTGAGLLDNNPRQHYVGSTAPGDNETGVGFRSANSNALRYQPPLQGSNTRPYSYQVDAWVVDETGATKENQYHKFSCSKCHNPHASRLPKLMITNCLDTVHNTWDNQFQLNTSGSSLNNNREIAQWTSAQNCHRYSESNNTITTTPEYRANRLASPAGSGAGWNKVTPWKQTTTTP